MVLLPVTTIGAAGTLVSPAVKGLHNCMYLSVQASFLYGAGGTSVNAYVQTSFDGGLSWMDVMNFSMATTPGTKVSAVTTSVALAPGIVPTDGTLAANTILAGLIGPMIRAKVVSVGTYTGATSLALYAVPVIASV